MLKRISLMNQRKGQAEKFLNFTLVMVALVIIAIIYLSLAGWIRTSKGLAGPTNEDVSLPPYSNLPFLRISVPFNSANSVNDDSNKLQEMLVADAVIKYLGEPSNDDSINFIRPGLSKLVKIGQCLAFTGYLGEGVSAMSIPSYSIKNGQTPVILGQAINLISQVYFNIALSDSFKLVNPSLYNVVSKEKKLNDFNIYLYYYNDECSKLPLSIPEVKK